MKHKIKLASITLLMFVLDTLVWGTLISILFMLAKGDMSLFTWYMGLIWYMICNGIFNTFRYWHDEVEKEFTT